VLIDFLAANATANRTKTKTSVGSGWLFWSSMLPRHKGTQTHGLHERSFNHSQPSSPASAIVSIAIAQQSLPLATQQ
jgi:hypothetical protein